MDPQGAGLNPDPAVAACRSALGRTLADLPPGGLVLVACSGGADSLALAAATAFLLTRRDGQAGLRAGAVIVDHGWFPGSAGVALVAAEACAGLGLDPVEVVPVAGPQPPPAGGPEAAARTARYAALDAAAQRHGASAVLLGHTLDDQAETVLLGLARGSGARSLAGMAERRGVYRRPLLHLSRAQTRQACVSLGLTPWDDPANADPAYARARVRAGLPELQAALGPGLNEALARTADLLREDADALDAFATDLLVSARADAPTGVALRVDVLGSAPAAVRRRALLAAARQAGSPPGALSRRHALAIDALVTGWRGQGAVHLPGRVLAHRACDTLFLTRDEPQE